MVMKTITEYLSTKNLSKDFGTFPTKLDFDQIINFLKNQGFDEIVVANNIPESKFIQIVKSSQNDWYVYSDHNSFNVHEKTISFGKGGDLDAIHPEYSIIYNYELDDYIFLLLDEHHVRLRNFDKYDDPNKNYADFREKAIEYFEF